MADTINPNQNNREHLPVEPAPLPMFNDLILNELRTTVKSCFSRFSELRSVGVILDFRGGLNDAKIVKTLWLTPKDEPVMPDAIFGSIDRTLELLQFQIDQATGVALGLRDVVLDEMKKLKKIRDEYAATKTAGNDKWSPANQQPTEETPASGTPTRTGEAESRRD